MFYFAAMECFELGRVAFTNKDFSHTVRWMSEALDQAEKDMREDSYDEDDEIVPRSRKQVLIDIIRLFSKATAKVCDLKSCLILNDSITNVFIWIQARKLPTRS